MTDIASWTIKSVPVEIRQKAGKAANAQGQTMAQWLGDAVNRLADQQANNAVLPPDAAPRTVALPSVDLAGLAAALTATVGAYAAAGRAPPLALGREASATLRRYMRGVRGLPDRQTDGQTRRLIGQTGKLIEGGDV